MEFERDVLVSPTTEVPVIEGQVVTAIRTLAGRGVGKKAIAREVGVAVPFRRRPATLRALAAVRRCAIKWLRFIPIDPIKPQPGGCV